MANPRAQPQIHRMIPRTREVQHQDEAISKMMRRNPPASAVAQRRLTGRA